MIIEAERHPPLQLLLLCLTQLLLLGLALPLLLRLLLACQAGLVKGHTCLSAGALNRADMFKTEASSILTSTRPSCTAHCCSSSSFPLESFPLLLPDTAL